MIENAIFKIIGALERWPIVKGQIRRYLILRFSYAILYRVYPDRIVIRDCSDRELSSRSRLLERSTLKMANL
jgi:hypothetical protein